MSSNYGKIRIIEVWISESLLYIVFLVYFGPKLYPNGSLVINHVHGLCVCRWACDSILMVKNILGVAPPPNHRKKLWKNGKCNHLALLLGRSKFSLTALTTIFETYQLLWVCHFTSIGGLVHKKSMILKIFGAYHSKFIFLHKNFFR